jgi:hypothetical protein
VVEYKQQRVFTCRHSEAKPVRRCNNNVFVDLKAEKAAIFFADERAFAK